jgi:hypothetical protein
VSVNEFPRVRNRRRTRSIVAAAVTALAATALVVVFVVQFASRRPDDVNLGDKRFVVGRADRFAERIDEQGAPILFKDPLTSKPGRELYVQHLGTDEKKGWLAVEAYAPGQRQLKCILQWDTATDEFVDPCTRARFPADGTGLTTYRGTVDERTAVIIDLRTRSTD